MDAFNAWDVALFAIAGYIALVSLVRLMIGRRDTLMRQVRNELERQRNEAQLRAEEAAHVPAAAPGIAAAAVAVKRKA